MLTLAGMGCHLPAHRRHHLPSRTPPASRTSSRSMPISYPSRPGRCSRICRCGLQARGARQRREHRGDRRDHLPTIPTSRWWSTGGGLRARRRTRLRGRCSPLREPDPAPDHGDHPNTMEARRLGPIGRDDDHDRARHVGLRPSASWPPAAATCWSPAPTPTRPRWSTPSTAAAACCAPTPGSGPGQLPRLGCRCFARPGRWPMAGDCPGGLRGRGVTWQSLVAAFRPGMGQYIRPLLLGPPRRRPET